MSVLDRVLQIFSVLVLLSLLLGMHARYAPSGVRPDQPRTYLRYGEVLAAEAQNPDAQSLARQVLAMGVLLAYRDGDHELAASGCIALANTHDEPDLRARAWDVALILDPSRLAAWSQRRASERDHQASRLGAQCLRLARNAKPGDARALFDRSGVRDAIMQAAGRLGHTEKTVRDALMPLLDTSRDDNCRGRVFYAQVEDGQSRRVLCGDHDHPVGGLGDPETLRLLLSIELECLNERGGLGSWAGSVFMWRHQPFEVPDLDWLADQHGIDPDRPYLVDGRWVAEP